MLQYTLPSSFLDIGLSLLKLLPNEGTVYTGSDLLLASIVDEKIKTFSFSSVCNSNTEPRILELVCSLEFEASNAFRKNLLLFFALNTGGTQEQ